eukprot:6007623-Ditylum_brightwellii.AAC.1
MPYPCSTSDFLLGFPAADLWLPRLIAALRRLRQVRVSICDTGYLMPVDILALSAVQSLWCDR